MFAEIEGGSTSPVDARASCARAKRQCAILVQNPSRRTPLARSAIQILGVGLATAVFALPCAAGAQGLRSYAVVGDAIPQSLTGAPAT